jgi:predicted Zn-dependent peptidase
MARDYTIGQTLMGLESTTNRSCGWAKSLLGYGHVLAPDEIERRIQNITPEDVKAVAREVQKRGRLGLAVVGPVKQPQIDALL